MGSKWVDKIISKKIKSNRRLMSSALHHLLNMKGCILDSLPELKDTISTAAGNGYCALYNILCLFHPNSKIQTIKGTFLNRNKVNLLIHLSIDSVGTLWESNNIKENISNKKRPNCYLPTYIKSIANPSYNDTILNTSLVASIKRSIKTSSMLILHTLSPFERKNYLYKL